MGLPTDTNQSPKDNTTTLDQPFQRNGRTCKIKRLFGSRRFLGCQYYLSGYQVLGEPSFAKYQINGLIANGILPTRGSVMLDLVAIGMLVVVAALMVSVYLVKVKRKYLLHKRIQLSLGILLLVVVTAFEIEMRFFVEWSDLAKASPFYESGIVHWALGVHLCFAIPTPLLWIYVIFGALRRFDPIPKPNKYSEHHRRFAWIAAIGMVLTAVTGWVFFVLAFVC